MAVTTAQTTDVTGALAELLRSVDGLRVHEFVADTARPPCVVIGQPTVDFNDQSGGWCSAVWLVPVNIITARNDAVAAQREMSRMLLDVVGAVRADNTDVISIEPLDARPIQVAVGGQELPAYLLNVRIRA
jgi:hypothetical protein